MGQSPVETEIKLGVSDLNEMRTKVERLGFSVARARVFEANTLYDTADLRLRSAGEVLRVRQAGDNGVLTFKGKRTEGRHKSRPEVETDVADPDAMAEILRRSGFEPVFRYEKYRTEYRRGSEPGVLVLDETPIGNFAELEGEPEWIDRVAAELGYAESDYLTASYGSLFAQSCEAAGTPFQDMVFQTHTVK